LGIPDVYIPILLLIPTYASATGFMFAAKHQLTNMADSGMTFALFKVRWGENNIPIYAVLFVTVLQYVLFLVINNFQESDGGTYRLCCIFACFLYMSLLCAFITFRSKFANMERRFTNPLGIPGACLGILIFFFVLVGLLFYQPIDKNALSLTFMSWIIIVTVCYFAYVQFTQFFSKEEQDKFMKAYILNANKRKKQSKWFKYLNQTINYITCGMPAYISKLTSTLGKKSMSNGASISNSRDKSAPNSQHFDGGDSVLPQPIVAHNKVAIAPTPQPQSKGKSTKSQRGGPLRASFQNGVVSKLTWSGKHLDAHESRKVFEILQLAAADEEDEDQTSDDKTAVMRSDGDDDGMHEVVAEQLLEHFPEHFIPVLTDVPLPAAGNDDIEMGGRGVVVRAAEST